MNKKFVRFYFAFVLLVFIFAITFFISRTYNSYKNKSLETQTSFFQLKNDVSDYEAFIKNIDFFAQDSNVIALQLLRNNKGLYVKNENFDFTNESRMIFLISDTFNDSENIYELKAAVYKLNPDTIYKNARISFLIILLFTGITAIFLIFLNQKSPADTKPSDISGSSDADISKDVNLIDETEDSRITDKEPELPELAEPVENTDITEAEEKNDSENQSETEQNSNSEENITVDLQSENSANETDSNSILQEILDSNIEASVFLIKADSTENYEKLKKSAEKYFEDDIIQNNENNILLIIKKNVNIDEAEDYASCFHDELLYEHDDLVPNSICIGISSTATRKINAYRLILEAEEALKHAINEKDSDIIGFHVDIDKYNEFIASEEVKQ